MFKFFQIYFLLFFIYSVLGWCMEILNTFRVEKKFVNRGFLVGPYCPIYGLGILLILLSVKQFKDNFLVTFIFSILVCGVLEYLTSFTLEKIFNARWWDYSKRKFNIRGRICAENLLIFGILGSFIIYILNPFILSLLSSIPNILLNIFSIIIFICFIVDIIVSTNVILQIKHISTTLKKDNTEEISKKVKKIIQSKLVLQKRFLKAFPNIRKSINLEDLINNAKQKINQIRKR